MTVIKLIIVTLILIGSIFLRLHNYDKYPQRGATSDEYTYSFLGVSLLTEGTPISWSTFWQYKDRKDLTIDNIYFPIVKPYFDHPPLHGLLVGSWALLNSENTFEKIQIKTIRLIPIALSLISSFLLYLIGSKLYGFKVGIWAILIFNTVTFFVMNTRIVVAENLLTVFLLSALYTYLQNIHRFSQKTPILLGILAGLSLLTKTLGIVVFLTILILFVADKVRWKIILIFIEIFLIFVGIYLGYAAYFDWNLFWAIQQEQSSRNIGPQVVSLITFTPVIVNKVVYDAWYFLGMFCLFLRFFDFRQNKYIVVPTIMYLLLLVSSLTREGHTGWYFIPFFPLMSLSIAQTLVEGSKRLSFIGILFLFFIGLFQIQSIYEVWFGLTPFRFRILLLLLFLPYLASLILRKERLSQWILNGWFYLFILGNIYITYYYVHPL